MLIAPLQLGLGLCLIMPLPVPNVLGLASLLRRRRTTRQQAAAGRQHWMTAPADPASSSRNATASSSTTTATTTTSRSSTSSSSSSTPWVVWYHPSMYWQQPRLRLSIIMCQRVLPPLFAALSVGYITPRFFELTSLRYWPMVGQYVFLGWKGFMLVVSTAPLTAAAAAAVRRQAAGANLRQQAAGSVDCRDWLQHVGVPSGA